MLKDRRALIQIVVAYGLAVALSVAAAFAFSRSRFDFALTAGSGEPYFSLSSNKTFSTKERALFWLQHQGIDYLDFRVYRVKDPFDLFKKLDDPHRIGKDERESLAASKHAGTSVLELMRRFKQSLYLEFKNYVRRQLRGETRAAVRPRPKGEEARLPLNVANYARLPLLNPDELVSSWRERLPKSDENVDHRSISLGRREAGVYLVEATNDKLRAYTVVIVSDVTAVAKFGPDGSVLAFVVDRASGTPRAEAAVEVIQHRQTLARGKTSKDGLFTARVDRRGSRSETEESSEEEGNPLVVMALAGNDFAITDFSYLGRRRPHQVYIYTERPIYRPGQTVYFKGIVRRETAEGYRLPEGRAVNVQIKDPQGEPVFDETLSLSPRGTFNGAVELAAEAALGNYRIEASLDGETYSDYFDVEEYKKPEYKVTVKAAKEFVAVGDKATFQVEAKYFFGAPVADAEVKYYIYRSRYFPWWNEQDAAEELLGVANEDAEGNFYGYGHDLVQEGNGQLDQNGRLTVEFVVPEPDESEPYDYVYRLEAQVTDRARRAITGKGSFVGTRGSFVAQATAARYITATGEPVRIEVATRDYRGQPVKAKVKLLFIKEWWERVPTGEGEDGQQEYSNEMRTEEIGSAEVTTDERGRATYERAFAQAANILIRPVLEQGGRQIAFSGDHVWVVDPRDQESDWFTAQYDSIELIADKKSYRPGETARLLAVLPKENAELLVTVERQGVMSARVLRTQGRAATIDIPVEAAFAPNVHVEVAFVRDGELYTGTRSIAVPARDRLLNIEIIPDKNEYKPRETASYTIIARNADGSPAAGAEVSLGVVDEAIYSLSPEIGDVRRSFYGRKYNEVNTSFATHFYIEGYSGDAPLIALNRPGAGLGVGSLADVKNQAQYEPPTIRKEFKDTAGWAPEVITGADGRATVQITLPDNLTTWRATAHAITADTRVGKSIVRVIARKDLILRLETPRFLSEGDVVTISGIVHNYLKQGKQTQVSLEVSGADLLGDAQRTLMLAPDADARLDWRVSAAQTGEVRLLAKALTDAESDAVELVLPVVPKGIEEIKGGTVAITQDEASETLEYALPPGAHRQARALRIELAPSIGGTLFGALDYLVDFPYGCVEQTMSRFLPAIVVSQALRDVERASVRDPARLQRIVRSGLARLYSLQHEDGGWGWWRSDESDPFMTAYVVDGLAQAVRAGYEVRADRLDRGRQRLAELLAAGKTSRGDEVDADMRAYMLYALSASGGVDGRLLAEAFAQRGELRPYGRALLALALTMQNDQARASTLVDELERSAVVGQLDAHWEVPSQSWRSVSAVETTAMAVKALARIKPQSPLLPKAARWLVVNRRNGYYWEATKQTAFAIYALTDFLRAVEEAKPDYTVEVFINDQPVFNGRFTADDVAKGKSIVVARQGAEVAAANRIRIVKRGRGSLYVAATLRYFAGDEIMPKEAGLAVTREYLRLRVVEGDGEKKPAWKLEPLTGEVRSGDLLVVRLRVRGNRASRLMIEDPIPAGCEQIARVSGIDLDRNEKGWTDWYSAREFRDQRTVIFLEHFDGDAVFQYALRVITPGDFRVAPTRAELMYSPEVRGHAGSARMAFLDRR